MKHIVVLTGAGMSAESGLKTFRDADGLWEGHDVMQVASPQGFASNPELVLEFYNQRRRQLLEVEPNSAHKDLASLEEDFGVSKKSCFFFGRETKDTNCDLISFGLVNLFQ